MKHKRNAILRIAGIVALVAAIGFSIAGCENGANGTVTADSSVQAPTASPPAGTYATAQNVLLACATAGAEIYYTLDGSAPTANSTPWAGLPIVVNANMTIRAIAIKAGWTNSGILTAGYVISGGGGTPPGTGVPAAPTGLTATAVSSSVINLTWNAVPGAAGYKVYNGTNPSQLGPVAGGKIIYETSATSTGLPANTTVYYQVTAVNASGESARSNTASATTLSSGTPTPTHSIDGVWEINGGQFKISASGSTGTFVGLNVTEPFLVDAVNKNYWKLGGQVWRNLKSTGALTWSGQVLLVTINTSNPNVATGTTWENCTFTMSADGQTLYRYAPASATPSHTYTRSSHSLDGVWEINGGQFRISASGSTGTFVSLNVTDPLLVDAVNKNYWKLGGQVWRSIKSTGALTWSGQVLLITYNTANPNVAIGTQWEDFTFTMSADGQTLYRYAPASATPSHTYTRYR